MVETQKGFFRPRHPKKYSGNVNNIIFRSSWEYSIMKRLDESDDVLIWGSEEIRVAYVNPIDNEWHTYFPDFLVRQKRKDGTTENVLVEVKPYHEVMKPKKRPNQKANTWNNAIRKWITNRSKWLAAMEWCKKNDVRFLIATKDNNWDKFQYITEEKLGHILNGG